MRMLATLVPLIGIAGVLLPAATQAPVPPPRSDVDGPPSNQRPEFEAIARKLREGPNEYFGEVKVDELRRQIEWEPEASLDRRLRLRALLIVELLKLGLVDEAVTLANEAVAMCQAEDALDRYPSVLRSRALAYLRKAEVRNCIARRNPQGCIFPLQGGGVHVEKAPAAQARRDYEAYLQRLPQDLGARWLLNIAAMAEGIYPDGVPEGLVIPPMAFVSDRDIGRFPDVGARLGIDTFNASGGAIVDDFDGDGFLDIVTSTLDPEGPLTYYRNDGAGGFEDRSAVSRATEQLGGLNCIGGDYDGDGDIDVLVLRGAWLFDDGRIRNSLLRREDDGTFTDVTRRAGLATPAAPTQTAAWGDFDGDGDLDLYVGNESQPVDPSGGDYPSQLFRNEGDGRFVDVAVAAGVTNDRYAKGVTVGDYDNDGDLDLFVSNLGPNRLYRNNGDGTFVNVAILAGVVGPRWSFATWFFDYDNDGWLDLFVASYDASIADMAADHLGQDFRAPPPALYRNRGNGTFIDVTEEAGLDHAWLPMGANFGDLDNDGFLDIYLATGDPSYETLVPNVMLRNDRGRRFENVTTSGGFGHLQKGHGVAFVDIDNDGDQDIYHQLGGFYPGDHFHNALFLNPGHGHRYLYISLVGTKTNRAGYGARIDVRVKTPDGPRRIHRAVGSVSSFGGSPARQEIGLGDATAIDSLEIWWPTSGTRQVFENVQLDSWITVTEGRKTYDERELVRVDLTGGLDTKEPGLRTPR